MPSTISSGLCNFSMVLIFLTIGKLRTLIYTLELEMRLVLLIEVRSESRVHAGLSLRSCAKSTPRATRGRKCSINRGAEE